MNHTQSDFQINELSQSAKFLSVPTDSTNKLAAATSPESLNKSHYFAELLSEEKLCETSEEKT